MPDSPSIRRRVAIVGAGAAGITAALRAAEAGASVTLLNAHPRIGLKILMSGGTRCNVTHAVVTERDFNGGSRPFVRRVLAEFPVPETLRWFAAMGVELKLEETGKYFPMTDDAHTVLEALLGAARSAGVVIEAGARVVRLERVEVAGGDGHFGVAIQTVGDSAAFGSVDVRAHGGDDWPLPLVRADRVIEADAVVLATGGLSFPRTGSDGVGYALARALGHTVEPPVPALTPLTADDVLCRLAQGVAADVELTLKAEGVEQVVRGSLLFTHFGYSGPAALDLSRHWLRAARAPDRIVRASFVPGTHEEQLRADLVRIGTAEPKINVRRVLARRMPERLADELCRDANADPTVAVSQLPRAARERLIEVLVRRVMPVNGTLGYEKAEVTAGGVRLSEVSPGTLESRVVPGLFLCGEILDVEGRLGGFNFQWAWSSGTVAGRSAMR